ncbi:MAG TPA: 23S rRNA (uracil(1939)-C(5))-methyltransferase RlmD [Rhodanobacteraceae bacterium]|jgi:23S rRNA (uracil1939-C5)-methyltransferase|nr:23S rRNA (uracil(1939)-C(5))-methyltransferase RlmD [Rhodanobacteraceae bacterium]
MGKPRDITFEASIDDLSHDGRGVAHVEGKTVFVADALPGERVRAKLVRKHRNFDEARTEEILEASPERVPPRCAHFGVCGGCVLQHLAPAAQIAAKQNVLAQNFARIGHVEPARWLAPLTADVWGYRRRARLSVKHVPKKSKTLVGFRERDPRFVADLAHCDVLDPALGERLGALGALLNELEDAASIPQIEFSAGDAARILVFRHLQPLSAPDREKLAAFGHRNGFAILLQPGGTDSVHALEPGDVDLHYSLPDYGLKLAFAPLDFVQVNARINQKMIAHALALLQPGPQDRVLDLFCGLGNFSLPIARQAAYVCGVEGDSGLVERARSNAAANGIANAGFHVGDLAGDVRGSAWARAEWDLLLLDPPRSGAEGLLQQLPGKSVRRVVYVSCHPASLARDAGTLVRTHGFRLEAAGVMDMFPHTAHVESIALFER